MKQKNIGQGPKVHFFYKDKDARDHMPINNILNKVNIPSCYFNNVKTVWYFVSQVIDLDWLFNFFKNLFEFQQKMNK